MTKLRTNHPLDETLPAWGVLVFESHHGQNFYMEPRQHSFVKLLYILAGKGAVVEATNRLDCRAGDIVVVPMGRRHRIADDPLHPLSLYALCVAPTVWAMDRSLAGHLPTGRVARQGRVADRVRVGLRRLLYEQTSRRLGYAAAMCGQTLELLAMLTRAAEESTAGCAVEKGNPRAKMRAYVRELDRRFYEATTLDDAAAELGIARRSFTQLFRQVTGRTWLRYVQMRRLEHARQLLRTTHRTVLAIAFECGYGDLSTFYRAFTGTEGCSPNAWRRRTSAAPPH